ncbi:MAG: hypothetical protein M1536_02375 [Firmicutes bacterium]|nr:hypothetical protein [Bacillota bacterium]
MRTLPVVKAKRGIALAVSLLLLSILLIIGIAIGVLGVQNLHMAKSASNSASAIQVAEAGIEKIRNTVESNISYGTAAEDFSEVLPTSGGRYWGSFSSTFTPFSLISVNNLGSGSPYTRPDGSIVPPYSLDIIVQARANGYQGTRDITIGAMYTNRWDQAVATSGTFNSAGGLTITGATTLSVANDILTGSSTGDLQGNLLANGTGNSVNIGSNYTITGTVTTPGIVNPASLPLQPGTLPIPNITWTFYTPPSADSTYQAVTSGSYSSLSFPQIAGKTEIYSNGSLSITGGLVLDNVTLSVNGDLSVSGGLNLVNSKIYVNGNLAVNGGIGNGSSNSTGGIFVCGTGNTTTIKGAVNFNASNTTGVAIYSQGDISLSGGAFVQGILYSHGNILAKGGAKLIGMAIANGNTTTEVEVTGGANFIYCPVYLQALNQMTTNQKLRKLSWRFL